LKPLVDESSVLTARRIAVVIGASQWPDLGPGFAHGREAFVHAAEGFRDYLRDPHGLDVEPDDLLWLFDESGSSASQLMEIRRHLSTRLADEGHRRGKNAWVFCYYVGHGAFAGRSSTYCLLLRSTQPRPLTEDTSLRLPTFADVLREVAPQSRRVLVLDSCFSAAAVQSFQAPLEQVTATKVRESVADQGVALLCASSASDAASFTQDRTKFTGAMLDVLTAGEAVAGTRLSLHRVCDLTQRRLFDLYGEEATRPECHTPNQSGGDISMVPLFPNPGATLAEVGPAVLPGGPPEAVNAPLLAHLPPVLKPQTAYRPLSVESDSWVWSSPAARESVVSLIGADLTRFPGDLVSIRLSRMAASPSTFFRGSFTVMARDMSSLPWSGVTTRLCGDSSIANAVITPTPDGRHVLDLGDYGETVVGPLEYDLCRLLVSMELAGHELGLPKVRRVLAEVIDGYLAMVNSIAARSALEQEYFSFDERVLEHLNVPGVLAAYRALRLGLGKPQTGLGKLQTKGLLDKSGTRLRQRPPMLYRVDRSEWDFVEQLVTHYKDGIAAERKAFLSRFDLLDVAARLVGVAGVGRRNYIALCGSLDGSERILLRLTEALPSEYGRWLSRPDEPTMSDGARVVLGTRAAQTSPDPLLDFVDLDGTSFVFRALAAEARAPAAGVYSRGTLAALGVSLAAFLAKVHLRHLDPHELQLQIGDGKQFRTNLGTWAATYAHQVEADHAEFVAAMADGTVKAHLWV
jgi:uncharacterized protein (DUF2252 family)